MTKEPSKLKYRYVVFLDLKNINGVITSDEQNDYSHKDFHFGEVRLSVCESLTIIWVTSHDKRA